MEFEYKNGLSEYDLKNIVWVGIEYDKQKLINFVAKYNSLLSKKDKNTSDELRIMKDILESHNIDNLKKLLNNDPEYSRWAIIEMLAKKASIEIAIDGKYSKDTFETISNLPTADFKLILKRTKELVNIINDVNTEVEMDTSKIPGIK